MKTKIYNYWTKLVTQLINDIIAEASPEQFSQTGRLTPDQEKGILKEHEVLLEQDAALYLQVDDWLDNAGKKLFQMGQGIYFGKHLDEYKAIIDPYSGKSGQLARDQLIFGFEYWFAQLLKDFPRLDNANAKEIYNTFATKIIGKEFRPFILARGDLTLQLVQAGDLKDIHMIYFGIQTLRDAAIASLEAMDEFMGNDKIPVQTPVTSVVPTSRGSSSPAFYKGAAPAVDAPIDAASAAVKSAVQL